MSLKVRNKSRTIGYPENRASNPESGENNFQNNSATHVENNRFGMKQECGQVQGAPRKRNGTGKGISTN